MEKAALEVHVNRYDVDFTHICGIHKLVRADDADIVFLTGAAENYGYIQLVQGPVLASVEFVW
ncbi:hypothetical protein GCM10011517_06360 [Actibacterium pelagium]|uniref:Uncharacterized protein n=1 Tax=Actibacterium pelagium TaxID=2029103 RepID=A0A917EJ26_9RHOB|nr:hypothetical protein GCM10011517_06360 [Actibacterium pelagium]